MASVLAEFQQQQQQGRLALASNSRHVDITPRTTPGLGLQKKGQVKTVGANHVDMNKFTLSASVQGDVMNDSQLIDDADVDDYKSVSGGTAAASSQAGGFNTANNSQFLSCGDLGTHGAISFKDIANAIDIVDIPPQPSSSEAGESEAAKNAPVPEAIEEEVEPQVTRVKQFVKSPQKDQSPLKGADGNNSNNRLPTHSSKDSTRTGGSAVGPICGALQPAFSSKATSKESSNARTNDSKFMSATAGSNSNHGGVMTADDKNSLMSRADSARSLRSGSNSGFTSMTNTKEKLEAAAKLADSLAAQHQQQQNASETGSNVQVATASACSSMPTNSALNVPEPARSNFFSAPSSKDRVPAGNQYSGPLRGGKKGKQLPPRPNANATSTEIAIANKLAYRTKVYGHPNPMAQSPGVRKLQFNQSPSAGGAGNRTSSLGARARGNSQNQKDFLRLNQMRVAENARKAKGLVAQDLKYASNKQEVAQMMQSAVQQKMVPAQNVDELKEAVAAAGERLRAQQDALLDEENALHDAAMEMQMSAGSASDSRHVAQSVDADAGLLMSGNVSPLMGPISSVHPLDVTARTHEDDADEQASLSYSVTCQIPARSPDSQASRGAYSKRQLEKIAENTRQTPALGQTGNTSKMGQTGQSKGSQVSLGASVLSAARGNYNHTGPHYNGGSKMQVGLPSGYEYKPKFRAGGMTNQETLLRERQTKDFAYKHSLRQSEIDALRRLKAEEIRTRQAERRDFHKKLQKEIAFNNAKRDERRTEEQDIKDFRRQMAKEDQAMRRQAEEMVRIAAAQEAFVEYQAQVEDNNYSENLSQIMAQQRITVVQYAHGPGVGGESRSASKGRKSSKGSAGSRQRLGLPQTEAPSHTPGSVQLQEGQH